ncbi:hypothetical protein GGX14DRAFT_647140 [Mycena pura]|uniref:Uncharacterized protein n=1 Tax=Mycena pura TaxID=153505 RepID=A0AAD6V6P3_9AGAR|nr:hypothetical protein GGX14DRAFT_647140 [Mycena pura]
MFNRSVSPSSSICLSPSLDSTHNLKKRRRQSSESHQLPPGPPQVSSYYASLTCSEGRVKPRRIDPDRLAIRLGPELVAEMDTYVVPGAKMPPFKVRQELVKRYNVDRRHIYDYLHSRGLRVSKEDKHLNLAHRMSRKPATSRKPLQVKLTQDMDNIPTSLPNPSATEAKPAPVDPTKPVEKRKTTAASCPVLPPQTSATPMLCPSQLTDLSSSSSDSEDHNSPTFESPSILTASSSFDFDLEMLSLSYPISDDKLAEYFGPEFTSSISTVGSREDPLSDLEELLKSKQTSENIPVSFRDSLTSLDDLFGFSQQSRFEFYNLVNSSIGSARGIEECAGTYKAHMEALYSSRSYPESDLHYKYNAYGSALATAVAAQEPVDMIHLPTRRETEDVDSACATLETRTPNDYYHRLPAVLSSPPNRRNQAVSSPLRKIPSPIVDLNKPSNYNSVDDFSSNRHTASNPQPRERPKFLVWTSPITTLPAEFNSQMQRTLQWSLANPSVFPKSCSPNGEFIRHTPTFQPTI